MCEHRPCGRSLKRSISVGAALLMTLILVVGWGWWVAPATFTIALAIFIAYRRTHAVAEESDRRIGEELACLTSKP